ncbi:hypothetical protein MHZ92_10325 [Sporosarcina sp. ACRSL]|uniref:hypothetical protein n=1 Tax=Sporosarcina sp. ACRSL TaxID=2918215 RepID=UPI001EF60B6C|nr:hypothetical protein [Sporosarcina sp. ACRSL]MCG7344532.1 hypothetical protein [Sporosarcina sp. ACRSL]
MVSTQSNWYVRFGCLAPIIGIFSLFYFINRDAFLPGFVFFGLFFGFAVIFLILSTRAEEKVKAKQLEHLETYKPTNSRFEESHSFVSDDLMSKIAIDEKNRRLYFWEPTPLVDGTRVKKAFLKMPYVLSDYSYDQLLAYEIYENGIRKQTFVKVAEGTEDRIEALGQSVEPIIDKKMSLTRKTILRKIATIEMKIILDNEEKPVQIIRFYSSLDKRLKKDSPDYIAIQRKVDQWVSLLTFILELDNKRIY